MSINWNFSADDYAETSFKPIPVGDYRVRIASAEEQTSGSGKQMIKLVLDVSGHNATIWHYLVLLPDNTKLTNQKLGELWNSFGIPQGNFDLGSWQGKVGAAKVKHEPYNGEDTAKIAYFISKDRQDKLPTWVEPSNKAALTGGGTTASAPMTKVEDLPWN
jgi:hypothetical protein